MFTFTLIDLVICLLSSASLGFFVGVVWWHKRMMQEALDKEQRFIEGPKRLGNMKCCCWEHNQVRIGNTRCDACLDAWEFARLRLPLKDRYDEGEVPTRLDPHTRDWRELSSKNKYSYTKKEVDAAIKDILSELRDF